MYLLKCRTAITQIKRKNESDNLNFHLCNDLYFDSMMTIISCEHRTPLELINQQKKRRLIHTHKQKHSKKEEEEEDEETTTKDE